MTNGDKILLDITTKKALCFTLGAKYIALSKNGETTSCKTNQLIVLTNQISALTRFYNNNFDANGHIAPIYTCPSTTLIRRYINPNYQPPSSDITINIIDGGNA